MPQRRLYLHLGLQKTGTSYLQGVLQHNREELAAQGLDLVPASRREAFELMLQVRDRYHHGRDPVSVETALERFAAALASAPGPRAVLSQESLAAARPRQVMRLLEACGDREVHVVLTVRDLARQLPSGWQQELKAGRAVGYRRYLRSLQASERSGRGTHPWIQLDAARVLERWSEQVPPERVHVVTLPPSGSPPTLLLERFCEVLEVDPQRLEPDDSPRNTSLGRVEAELLRRVNAALPDGVRRRQVYGDVGKRWFTGQVLAEQSSRRIAVPEELREWCDDVAGRQVDALSAAGYRVAGSLEELRCPPGAFSDDERRPREREVAAAAVAALARVLTMRAGSAGTPGPGRGRGGPASGSGTALRRLVSRLRGRRTTR